LQQGGLVGDPDQRLVGHAERAVCAIDAAQPFLAALALDRHADHIGRGLQEVDLVRRECSPLSAVGAKRAVWLFGRRDGDADRARGWRTERLGQRDETCLRGGILDDHRTGGQDRISGLRTGPFDRRAPHQSIVPADARPEQECLAVRQHLGDIAIFDPQAAGDAGGRVVQQIGQW